MFRKIYFVAPVRNWEIANSYCMDVEFLTSGMESVEELPEVLRSKLVNFDPEKDAVVATGSCNSVLLAGMILQELFPEQTKNMGLFQAKDRYRKFYHWVLYNPKGGFIE